MQSHPDFGLAQSRVLARREAHVAGEDELAAHAPDTASDLRDADHRGLGETHERIQQDREARSPDSSHDVPYLAGQIKVGKIKLGIRASRSCWIRSCVSPSPRWSASRRSEAVSG